MSDGNQYLPTLDNGNIKNKYDESIKHTFIRFRCLTGFWAQGLAQFSYKRDCLGFQNVRTRQKLIKFLLRNLSMVSLGSAAVSCAS